MHPLTNVHNALAEYVGLAHCSSNVWSTVETGLACGRYNDAVRHNVWISHIHKRTFAFQLAQLGYTAQSYQYYLQNGYCPKSLAFFWTFIADVFMFVMQL